MSDIIRPHSEQTVVERSVLLLVDVTSPKAALPPSGRVTSAPDASLSKGERAKLSTSSSSKSNSGFGIVTFAPQRGHKRTFPPKASLTVKRWPLGHVAAIPMLCSRFQRPFGRHSRVDRHRLFTLKARVQMVWV
jgi:hypothetical protein